MADQITETTVTGFMQGIMQSIKGVIVGAIWNAGRLLGGRRGGGLFGVSLFGFLAIRIC